MLEALRLFAPFRDVFVVRWPIQECGSHLRTAKHMTPFSEAPFGGIHHIRMLAALEHEVEEQDTADRVC